MKKLTLVFLLLAIALLMGCETAKGAGKGFENTGENIQEGGRNLENRGE